MAGHVKKVYMLNIFGNFMYLHLSHTSLNESLNSSICLHGASSRFEFVCIK